MSAPLQSNTYTLSEFVNTFQLPQRVIVDEGLSRLDISTGDVLCIQQKKLNQYLPGRTDIGKRAVDIPIDCELKVEIPYAFSMNKSVKTVQEIFTQNEVHRVNHVRVLTDYGTQGGDDGLKKGEVLQSLYFDGENMIATNIEGRELCLSLSCSAGFHLLNDNKEYTLNDLLVENMLPRLVRFVSQPVPREVRETFLEENHDQHLDVFYLEKNVRNVEVIEVTFNDDEDTSTCLPLSDIDITVSPMKLLHDQASHFGPSVPNSSQPSPASDSSGSKPHHLSSNSGRTGSKDPSLNSNRFGSKPGRPSFNSGRTGSKDPSLNSNRFGSKSGRPSFNSGWAATKPDNFSSNSVRSGSNPGHPSCNSVTDNLTTLSGNLPCRPPKRQGDLTDPPYEIMSLNQAVKDKLATSPGSSPWQPPKTKDKSLALDYKQMSTGHVTSPSFCIDNIYPSDLSIFSVADIQSLLKAMGLGRHAEKFGDELVDGVMLMELDDVMLVEYFGFAKFHALKLAEFISRHKSGKS